MVLTPSENGAAYRCSLIDSAAGPPYSLTPRAERDVRGGTLVLIAGARLGPYEILHPIGAGGMGEVHRARDVTLGRDAAIKVLPAEVATDYERLARFQREARTTSALNHPNIVTIYDVAEQDGTAYIAMEFVEGLTLSALIANGPLPIDQTIRVSAQIADGLATAHEAGIMHRDIKPANIMITGDGGVKILDFGLAKTVAVAGARTIPGLRQTSPTREGFIVGTPHYMSPEQLSGDTIDARSDQFALGVVLYQMLSARPPFDGRTVASIIKEILLTTPPPLRTVRHDMPEDLEDVVNRCLEKDPSDRFSSTAAVAAAIRRCGERPVSSRRPGILRGVLDWLDRWNHPVQRAP